MRKKRIAAAMVVLGVFMVVGLATGLTLFWQGTGARDADAASPAQTFYLEGTIYDGLMCGCILLDAGGSTYELYGDLGGFTCGDRVGVWVAPCPDCVTVCMAGTPVIVQDIVGLPDPTPADPVGGIAEIPGVAERGSSTHSYIALVGAVGGVLVALTTGAWYGRRRWLR